jgi:hypothetical protein
MRWQHPYSSRRNSNWSRKIISKVTCMDVLISKSSSAIQSESDVSSTANIPTGDGCCSYAATGHKGKALHYLHFITWLSLFEGAGSIYACVWDATTGVVLRRLNCGEVNSASAIAFCKNGDNELGQVNPPLNDILAGEWLWNICHLIKHTS